MNSDNRITAFAKSTDAPPLQPMVNGLPFGASLFTTFLCIIFGANAVAVKISFTGLGVFTNVGLRFGLAGLTLLLWALLAKIPIALSRAQLPAIGLIATIFSIQFALFNVGLDKTTASHATLIANVLPFLVMILAHYFIPGETINRRKIFGLLLGFSGVVFLIIDTLSFSLNALLGDLFILCAVCCWSGHVIYIKKIINQFHPIQISLYPMLIAAPIFLISGFFFDDQMVNHINPAIISAFLYQTFISASFGFAAWNSMIQRFGATALHSFVFLMPISGVSLGILLLNEPLTANLIGSIVLVVIGLIIVNKRE